MTFLLLKGFKAPIVVSLFSFNGLSSSYSWMDLLNGLTFYLVMGSNITIAVYIILVSCFSSSKLEIELRKHFRNVAWKLNIDLSNCLWFFITFSRAMSAVMLHVDQIAFSTLIELLQLTTHIQNHTYSKIKKLQKKKHLKSL